MNRLRELRNEFGYTIRDFDKYNLGRNVITYIENGKTDLNLEKLATFCEIFQVSADYFTCLSNEGIYVNYQNNTYSLKRDDFLKYKDLGFIKYQDSIRIIEFPDNYDLDFIEPLIKLIQLKSKKN